MTLWRACENRAQRMDFLGNLFGGDVSPALHRSFVSRLALLCVHIFLLLSGCRHVPAFDRESEIAPRSSAALASAASAKALD